MGLREWAFVVEICREAVPVFQADLEDFHLVDFGDEQQVVKRLQEALVHLPLLDEGAVLLQISAEEQSLPEMGQKE